MGYGFIPEENCPDFCAENACEHKDCRYFHEMSRSICHYCGNQIGYGKRYYLEDDNGTRRIVHALCAEEAVEKN